MKATPAGVAFCCIVQAVPNWKNLIKYLKK